MVRIGGGSGKRGVEGHARGRLGVPVVSLLYPYLGRVHVTTAKIAQTSGSFYCWGGILGTKGGVIRWRAILVNTFRMGLKKLLSR